LLNLFGQIVLLLCIVVSVGFFFKEVWKRVRLVKTGLKDEKRWDKPVQRSGFVIGKVASQLCSIKDRPIVGVMHAFVFWGFVFFTVATINHVVGAFVKGFSLWGKGLFNNIWFLGVDIIAVFCIIGSIYLAVRRYFVKPAGITKPMPISRSPQSAIVLSLIFGLMLTYLLNQGAEIILNGESFATWMPFTRMTIPILAGMNTGSLEILNDFFWWSHILMVLAFLVFIPHSKHFHLIAGPVNMFLRSHDPIGTLKKIDFEKVEEFGVTNINQFQWKNIVDFFSCVDCGRCQDVCPAFQSDKALSPKVIMMSLRKHILSESNNLFSGNGPSESVMETWITANEIWACTTCGACMETCPVSNEHIPTILELRRAQMMMENKFPQELSAAFKGLETNSNPWNMGSSTRAVWTLGLDVPLMAEKQEVDYLWYVGCAGSFDDRGKEISKAFAKILNNAGVSYAILGEEEGCCGDPARRAGNEYLFQMNAEQNIETFKQYKFKKIVTCCPHGYHMLKNEYIEFSGEYEVIHHTQLIAELIEQGKINISPNANSKVTFHDSCYLGRYNDIFDEPRQILKAVNKQGLVEMPRAKNKSFCCGAGGGRMFMEETEGKRINHIRIEEAQNTGATTVGTACPFCMSMFDDGIKEKGIEEKLKVQDIAQIISNAMS